MATLNDHQLIQQIQQGRREALGLLFDRYGDELYDFLARVVGDRDETARLIGEVFQRVPTAVAAFPPHESVRGTLYALAREASLNALRQKGWLDALPPLEETSASALASDIWKAARAMPAFHRAVLVIDELHGLSPTEKARALGVARTDLARVSDEARQSFNRQFDSQARTQGRPVTSQIDTERIIGLTRRVPDPEASLFSFLPPLLLPESLKAKLRSEIVSPLGESKPRFAPPTPEPAVESTPGEAQPVPIVVEIPASPVEPQPAPEPATYPAPNTTTTYQRRVVRTSQNAGLSGGALLALLLLAGLIFLIVLAAGIYYLTQDRSKPVIDLLTPADGSSVAQAPLITVTASFEDDRGIDPTTGVKLYIDGAEVTLLALITEGAASYSGPFTIGLHTAEIQLKDKSGNLTDKKWSFFVVTAPTPTPSATATVTRASSIPSTTPQASSPPVATTQPPVGPPISPTPCVIGIQGIVFNDANGNLVRDFNEPALVSVRVTLQNYSGQVLAIANTDSFGRYTFVSLPNGIYRVSVIPPVNYWPTTPTAFTTMLLGCGAFTIVDFGFLFGTPTPTNTPPPTQTPIYVTATPTFTPIASLKGTVTNSKYAYPLAGVSVGISGPTNSATTSGTSGQYSFPSVLPGVYNVLGARTGYQNGGGSLTVPPSTNSTFNFILVPCVSIVPGSTTVAPSPQVSGADITLGYTLNNACATTVQLYLGSRIRRNGTSTIYVDPVHDALVAVPPSVSSAQVRLFMIPASAAPGLYDVEWTIWESKSGSSLTGKYDGVDFVLNALTVVAPSPTPSRTPTSTPTHTPTVTKTPTPTSTPP